MAIKKILDELMSYNGIVTQVYGKYADNIIYDQTKERAKQILYHVYGYKGIFALLPPELDEVKTMDHVRTLMQIDIMQNNPELTSIWSQNIENNI